MSSDNTAAMMSSSSPSNVTAESSEVSPSLIITTRGQKRKHMDEEQQHDEATPAVSSESNAAELIFDARKAVTPFRAAVARLKDDQLFDEDFVTPPTTNQDELMVTRPGSGSPTSDITASSGNEDGTEECVQITPTCPPVIARRKDDFENFEPQTEEECELMSEKTIPPASTSTQGTDTQHAAAAPAAPTANHDALLFDGTADVAPFRPEDAHLKTDDQLFEEFESSNHHEVDLMSNHTAHPEDPLLELEKARAQARMLERILSKALYESTRKDENSGEAMRSQIQSLRSERLLLLQELKATQRECRDLKEEKQRIQEAAGRLCNDDNYVETVISKISSSRSTKSNKKQRVQTIKKPTAKKVLAVKQPRNKKSAKAVKKATATKKRAVERPPSPNRAAMVEDPKAIKLPPIQTTRDIQLPESMTVDDIDNMNSMMTLEICRMYRHLGLKCRETKKLRADQVRKLFAGKKKGYVLHLNNLTTREEMEEEQEEGEE